jgi:protein gp37
MGKNTAISWATHTFNLWTSCTKDGAECAHCYAESWAKRAGRGWGPRAPRPRTAAAYWRQPKRWNDEAAAAGERHRVFVGSLMDWAEGLPGQSEMLEAFWSIVRECQHLDFLLLTKRAHNMRALLPADWSRWSNGYPNVWLIVSIGDPAAKSASMRAPAIERARHLVRIPAVVHGISYEPALAPLARELEPFMIETGAPGCCRDIDGGYWHAPGACPNCQARLDWVIYGGESGPGWRPEGEPGDPKAWARQMRDACRRHDVAFFHKQSAGPRPGHGEELDGQIIQQVPTPAPTHLLRAA